MNMQTNNNGLDGLYKKAAHSLRHLLSADEKEQMWQRIQKRRRIPVFWYWTTAGTAVVIVVLIAFIFSENTLQDPGTLKPVSELADVASIDPILNEELLGENKNIEDASIHSQTSINTSDEPTFGTVYQQDENTRGEYTLQGVGSDAGLIGGVSTGTDIERGSVFPREETSEEIPFTSAEHKPVAFLANKTPLSHFGSDIRSKYQLSHLIGSAGLNESTEKYRSLLARQNNKKELAKQPLDSYMEVLAVGSTMLLLSEIELKSIKAFAADPASLSKNSRSYSNWFMDIYYRQEWNKHSYHSNRNLSASRNKWENTIEPYFSFAAGIAAGRSFFTHFNFSIGMEYRRVLDKFDYDESSIDYKMIYNEQAYFLQDEAGEIHVVGDSVLTSIRNIQRMKAPNTQHYLRIPMRLEFTYPIGRFQLGLSSGLSLNILRRQSGYVPAMGVGFREMNENDKESGIGPDFNMGLFIGYQISDHLNIFLRTEKYFEAERQSLGDTGIEKSTNTAAVSVAIRKNF